jgi:hypothetical protein
MWRLKSLPTVGTSDSQKPWTIQMMVRVVLLRSGHRPYPCTARLGRVDHFAGNSFVVLWAEYGSPATTALGKMKKTRAHIHTAVVIDHPMELEHASATAGDASSDIR